MRHPSRVHELIPLVNGLFAHMDYQFWDFTADELEILMESRFGQRPVAPLLDIIQGPPDDPCMPRKKLNDEQLTLLASIILKTFRNKWDRLGAIHSLEYDVLKNYLDEYQEVLRDDTDTSTARESSRANEDSEVSRLTTTSGTEGEQSNISSNESTNTRNDAFNSEFSRVSKDSQVRTDDLEEAKVRSESTAETRTDDLEESLEKASDATATRTDNLNEASSKRHAEVENRTDDLQETLEKSVDSTSTRTDNLTDATTGSGSENITHSGGDYQESTERTLAATGTENGSTGIFGFNSSDAVGDSTSDKDATRNENETVLKTHTGSRTDNTTTSQNNTTHHTGTQGNVTDTDESYTKANTGTQDKKNVFTEDVSKVNTGTQENESEGHESSTRANTGTQQTDTDVDESYIKANRGTQGIEEDTSISDATYTTDEQESASISHGASSGKTTSQATTDSDTESTKSSVSRLNDSVIVNSALARAKQSIHKGNIGNLTPQQLITQEIELWRWNFIDEVMSDIKSMITIPIYI